MSPSEGTSYNKKIDHEIMKVGSIALASTSVVLLLIYETDVEIEMMFGNSFLGIDDLSRGLFLGGSALILPIIANYTAKKSILATVCIDIIKRNIDYFRKHSNECGLYSKAKYARDIARSLSKRDGMAFLRSSII
jgi:hypothetical protein